MPQGGWVGPCSARCVESDDLRLVGAVTEPNDKLLGRDAGELVGAAALAVPLTDDLGTD